MITVLVYFIPPLELKPLYPVWKFFQNPRFSLSFSWFKGKEVIQIPPTNDPTRTQTADPRLKNFFWVRGGNKVHENGKSSIESPEFLFWHQKKQLVLRNRQNALNILYHWEEGVHRPIIITFWKNQLSVFRNGQFSGHFFVENFFDKANFVAAV